MGNPLTEEQIRRIKSIETAGRSTLGIGWMIVALTPLVTTFLYGLPFAFSLVFWVFCLIIGTYLIFSGKNILYSDGRHSRAYLWTTLLISLVFIGSIVALIVTLECLIAIIAYEKIVKELGEPVASDKELPIKTKEIIIYVIIIVVNAAVFFVAKDAINTNAVQKAATSSQSSSTIPYGN